MTGGDGARATTETGKTMFMERTYFFLILSIRETSGIFICLIVASLIDKLISFSAILWNGGSILSDIHAVLRTDQFFLSNRVQTKKNWQYLILRPTECTPYYTILVSLVTDGFVECYGPSIGISTVTPERDVTASCDGSAGGREGGGGSVRANWRGNVWQLAMITIVQQYRYTYCFI